MTGMRATVRACVIRKDVSANTVGACDGWNERNWSGGKMTQASDVAYQAGMAAGSDLRGSAIDSLARENKVLRAVSAVLALALGVVLWRR